MISFLLRIEKDTAPGGLVLKKLNY